MPLAIRIPLFVVAFALPGCLLWASLRPARRVGPSGRGEMAEGPGSFVLAGSFLGWLVLTTAAYFVSISANVALTPWVFLALAGALSAVAAVPLALRRARGETVLPAFRRPRRGDLVAVAALVLIGLVWWRNQSVNQAVSSFCMKENVTILVSPPDGPADGAYLSRHVVGDQREGGPAFVAGAAAFFPDLRWPGIAFALCGVALAAFTFLAARAAFRRTWVAAAVAAVAAIHPYLFRIRGVDENLISLAVSAFLAWLLLARERSLLPIAGAAFAVLFNVRHENVLLLPAVAFLAWRFHGPRGLARLLVPAALFLLPTFWRHWRAMGSPLAYESFLQFPEPVEHSLLGVPFRFRGLLNFPFHPEVVRTPFNPHPTFLMWPLYVARYSGLAFCAACAWGAVHLWRRDRVLLAFVALWLLPMGLLLSVLEHWDYPSKMSVIVVLFEGVFLLLGAGLAGVAEARGAADRAGLVATAIAVPAAFLGLAAVPPGAFPADPRYLDARPCVRPERPIHLAAEAAWLADVGILPAREVGEIVRRAWSPPPDGTGLPRDTFQWYSDRTLDWVTRDHPLGEPADVFFDLRRDPAWPADALRSGPGPSDAFAFEGGGVELSGVSTRWSDRPVHVEVTHESAERTLRVSVIDCRADRLQIYCAGCADPRTTEVQVREDEVAASGGEPPRVTDLGGRALPGISFRLDLPVWLVFSDVVNWGADVAYVTEGVLDSEGFHPAWSGKTVSN